MSQSKNKPSIDHRLYDDIQIFRDEIEAVIDAIAQLEGKTLKKSPAIQERIRQCFVTWSRLKVSIESPDAQNAQIAKIDNLLEECARNSGRHIQKRKFREQLRDANKLLAIIYVKAAKIQSTYQQHSILEEISDLPDELIPKALVGWKSHIKVFLRQHPFDQNVFVMMRYAKPSAKTLAKVTEQIQLVSDSEGRKFFPVVAWDHDITDNLDNPIACLLCCRYGIAVFDTAEKLPKFNPNVTYELGMMHLLQRECLILKSTSIKSMPADILHKIYVPFSSLDEVAAEVDTWLRARNT